jgi:predicted ester cyclase
MSVLGDEATGPEGLRAYWAEFFGATPDLRFEVQDIVAEGDQVAVHWAAKGTFAGRTRSRASSRRSPGSTWPGSTSSTSATA